MQIPLSIVGVEHDPDTPSLLRTLEVCIGIGTSDTGIEASGTLGASGTLKASLSVICCANRPRLYCSIMFFCVPPLQKNIMLQ